MHLSFQCNYKDEDSKTVDFCGSGRRFATPAPTVAVQPSLNEACRLQYGTLLARISVVMGEPGQI